MDASGATDIRCPVCGGLNPADADWCGQCHNRLTQPLLVPTSSPGGPILGPIVPGAPPVPRRRHWASDPTQSRIFMAVGPLVILVAGLVKAGPDTYSVGTFLIAYPFITAGLITAMLILGGEAAARYEGRPAPPNRRVQAIAAMTLAVLAFPLAMLVNGQIPIEAFVTVLVGAGFAIAIFAWPKKGPSENWLFVPAAVLVGAACAGAIALISLFGSIWRFDDPGDPTLGVVMAWVLGGLAGYAFMVMARSGAEKPMPSQRVINGAIATALASIVTALLAISLLS